MSAHSPVCESKSIEHLAQCLRAWRIALVAYVLVALFAAGSLSTEVVAVLLFAGFSAMTLFVFRLKSRIAALRMERYLEAFSETARRS
jgi:hypothetical protein